VESGWLPRVVWVWSTLHSKFYAVIYDIIIYLPLRRLHFKNSKSCTQTKKESNYVYIYIYIYILYLKVLSFKKGHMIVSAVYIIKTLISNIVRMTRFWKKPSSSTLKAILLKNLWDKRTTTKKEQQQKKNKKQRQNKKQIYKKKEKRMSIHNLYT